MNEPGGQQPYRAVLEPALPPVHELFKVSHAPPHNDRLNPLSIKTETKETDQCMRRRNNTICGWWVRLIFLERFQRFIFLGKKIQHEKSTLTFYHSGDLARLPLGQI
jgi:hypothetical protein